ncbi:cholesterol esterase [Onygenales sp. PD_12]|nr:cholesterol esterase [Onygenales sp. PD_12]
MGRVPLIGRLFWNEYLALFSSLFLIFAEGLLHIITYCLPAPIIQFCYRQSKRVFKLLSPPQARIARKPREDLSGVIARASDFVELCALWGYEAEEHVVQTGDGYLLGLHRLPYKKGQKGQLHLRANAGEGTPKKPVVYLHHGLLMNSEVWVCMTEEERCLPFQLVEQGYDVWFGNNRGNKYSKKSALYTPSSTAFWNFSMDQFAFHDIPDSIEYILSVTSQPTLSYIGFSQGTAQAFATLSIHPALNHKVNLFIALAPAMSPAGLSNGVVDALMKASPDVLFLAFGRRSILSSTPMWQTILYPPIFVRIIDRALCFLFNWTGKNITTEQKLAAYPHLYSFTSTKSVVHWFQIIRNKSFQMYDDNAGPSVSINNNSRYYKPAKFPTKNIKTPIVLFYGRKDSLVDIDVMLEELPSHTVATSIPHYEHLDFLWANDVCDWVFPSLFEALGSNGLTHLVNGEKTASHLLTESSLNRKENEVPPSSSQPQSPTTKPVVEDAEQKECSPDLPSYSDDERLKSVKTQENEPN